MKVRIDSKWSNDVHVHMRSRQLSEAARLLGYGGFAEYAGIDKDMCPDRQAAIQWVEQHNHSKLMKREETVA